MEVGEERSLALVAVGVRGLDDRFVVRDDHPALAAGDDLGRVERERARDPEGAGAAAAERAAVCVGGVLDEVHAARPAELFEGGNGRADEAADVHRHDGRGVRGEPRLDVGEIERHRLRVAVDEDHAGAGVDRGRGGREEGVRRDDDLAALDVERAQDDLERTRTRAHRDRVVGRMTLGERGLELAADRPERQLAARERLIDPGQDLGAVFGWERNPRRGHAHRG